MEIVWDMKKIKGWDPSLLRSAGLAFKMWKEKASGRRRDATKHSAASQPVLGEKPSGGREMFHYAYLLGQKTYLELC